ncbi:hypothetical protein BGZ80_010967 [Entomortierella chlamydospora]|uniref:G domain-containing protein n=1 Tax=Entomortierella chlamydospora TaxID=101097 RepID=A0A9P6SZM5_9FUNG|nr:hypothetical protein BGZ80_010967 [Entomortierella chlamydospora]
MTREKGTKIVIVMGIIGAGKSYLIKEISGRDVKVGHSLGSCTQDVEEVRCQIDGQSVMILDTPGFDDTNRSDTEVLTDIAEYLSSLYKAGYRISGIIYLHNITDTRMRGSSLKNMQMFAKLCGEKSYRNVVLLTGRWDTIDQADAVEKENDLKKKIWKEYLDAGCQLDRYWDKNDLVRIFKTILQKPPVVLDIQREMAVEGKALDKTAAGEQVNIELSDLKKKFESELAEIDASYNNQIMQMRDQMDEERLKLQHKLKRLETDKLMMVDQHRRVEEASKAGMLEQFRKLEQKREEQRVEYERELERAMTEKDENLRESARLDALVKFNRVQRSYRNEEQGFWGIIGQP